MPAPGMQPGIPARPSSVLRTVAAVAHGDADYLLELTTLALAEIDERAIEVTARRVARLASLMGDTVLAVRLGLELKGSGGHPPTNAQETRRMMADSSGWADPSGPAEQALAIYLAARMIDDGPSKGMVAGQGLSELRQHVERMDNDLELDLIAAPDLFRDRQHMDAIIEGVRHSCFTALVAWERELAYSNLNVQIFDRFRSSVDTHLALGAPDVLDQFLAVYRRLREAAARPAGDASEEVAQAAATCRRILKAVADHLLPGVPGASGDGGHKLDDASYRNRLFEFIKTRVASDRTEEAIRSALGGVFERFAALDALASKGVHAELALAEAEMCAIGTYLAAGELLRLGDSPPPEVQWRHRSEASGQREM